MSAIERSIFSVQVYDEYRWFVNTSGMDAESLYEVYRECEKPFVDMGAYGEVISAGEYAELEQGDELDFSVAFNGNNDEVVIFDGNSIRVLKSLDERLLGGV